MLAAPAANSSASNLLDKIGNTPLFRMQRLAREFPGIELYGKAEFFNPGGSVKDRPGLNMIEQGERSGQLTPDKTMIDATSGNTGIAYAMIAACKGYRVKLCLPENASPERKHILRAFGAEMVFSDAGEGSDGAIRLFIPISTTTRPTGRLILKRPRLNSWNRPKAASRTL
jgi:cysteine synthase B